MTKAINEINAQNISIQFRRCALEATRKSFLYATAGTDTFSVRVIEREGGREIEMESEKVKIIITISLYSSTNPFGPIYTLCLSTTTSSIYPGYFLLLLILLYCLRIPIFLITSLCQSVPFIQNPFTFRFVSLSVARFILSIPNTFAACIFC